jgi:Na+/proline symporter
MPVTVVAAAFAVREVGGVGAFVDRLPPGHLDAGSMFDSPIMMLWVGAIVVKQYISSNNLFDASRYICVKDGRHARRAAIMAAALFVIGPIVWFTTPMAARILHPDLSVIFPDLRNPAEGAFFATCLATLPTGMLGLLISGILAATMSSMDSGLNRNAGIFVRNFYQPVLRPAASDREMVLAGRISTGVMGVLVIVAGLNFSRLENVGLFELMLTFGSLVAVPYTIPLTLCMFVRRTPPWSGWSTVAVCMLASFVSTRYFDADWVARTFDLAAPLTAAEAGYWTIAAGLALNVSVGCLWFFGSMAFWNRTSAAHRERISAFHRRMRTPVDFAREEGPGNDAQQGNTLGFLCLFYGGFICLLSLIPNPLSGRISFLFCGGVVVAIGIGLRRSARRQPPPPETIPASEASLP